MTITSTTKRIREIISDVQEGKLIPKPPFQRRKVWSNKDKSYFIDTILRGYPFPEIYWADGDVDVETGKGTTLIVDGQQRVTTLVEYFIGSDSLKLSQEVTPYSALTDDKKKAFLDYVVVVRHLGNMPNDKLIDIFSRINVTSYNLNPMEINHAVYDGPLKQLAEQLAQLEFFTDHRVFRPIQLKRMGDTRYVLSIIVTMLDGYFNRDDKLEEYLIRFNDTFPKEGEVRQRFLQTLEFIESCDFGPQSRIWQQTTLYCLLCEIDRILLSEPTAIDPSSTYNRLSEFFALWNDMRDFTSSDLAMVYDRASVQAANDRKNRVRRGNILRQILLGKAEALPSDTQPHKSMPLFDDLDE